MNERRVEIDDYFRISLTLLRLSIQIWIFFLNQIDYFFLISGLIVYIVDWKDLEQSRNMSTMKNLVCCCEREEDKPKLSEKC